METRQIFRISKRLLIKVNGLTSVMVDISKIGMKLILPILLKRREVVITFRMDNRIVDLKGDVRWIHKEPTIYDQAQYQVGVLLDDPPEEYLEMVDELSQE